MTAWEGKTETGEFLRERKKGNSPLECWCEETIELHNIYSCLGVKQFHGEITDVLKVGIVGGGTRRLLHRRLRLHNGTEGLSSHWSERVKAQGKERLGRIGLVARLDLWGLRQRSHVLRWDFILLETKRNVIERINVLTE